MADGEVVLLIRSPSLKQDEREIRAARSCSVRELKSQLHRELPGEPKEEDQRLIYSGKLLPDHLKLNEVLSKENRHVLHLVCSARSPPQTQGQDKTPPANTASTNQPSIPPIDGLRQRNNAPQNVPTANRFTSPPGANPAISPYAVYSPQQLIWLQQMYARQYYMQYYAAAAAANPRSPSQSAQEIPVVPAAAPDPLPHRFPAENQPQNPDVQAPVNPVANPNMRMNAQGGLVEEEEDLNRDWLDWVYSAARFAIFLSILYFYSSLSRFMMVLGAMILMYLHHAGWFPFRQRQLQQVVNPAPQAAPNQQDQNNNLQENEIADEALVEDAAAATLQTQSFVTTAWIFFKTFFASLIPEGPPAIVQ
ncbi:homocysteine-responsive endoplasmic reticulum-resident ubiquitin-like domain member 1 protein [Pelobates fuscus]|uniref:homocysteine-responsive endoplasmic reticulum-resident ubiquitin-like domain member 1 protein n=1 Tax=Pelobates fuscus TaxID=191477 RepID=UPI002FE4A413